MAAGVAALLLALPIHGPFLPVVDEQALLDKVENPPPAPAVDVAPWVPTVTCECSGSWDCPDADDFLHGLQFHPDTWASHGGLAFGPNPTPVQQVIVAERVLASHSGDPWPNCPNPGD